MIFDREKIRALISNSTPKDIGEWSEYSLASVFLLFFENDASRVFFIQKTDTWGYPWRNQVALPGGRAEKEDKDAKATAYRELVEETCIPADQIEYIGTLGRFMTIAATVIEVHCGFWTGEGPVKYDETEIARVLEIPLEELAWTHLKNGFHGRKPHFTELIYPYADTTVWGATANIIHHLIEELWEIFPDKLHEN